MGTNSVSDWRAVETIRDDVANIAVVIKRDFAVTWPKYSVECGNLRSSDDSVSRFVGIRIERPSVGVVVVPDTLRRLNALLEAAEGFLQEDAQRVEDERLEAMRLREEAQASREQRKQRG